MNFEYSHLILNISFQTQFSSFCPRLRNLLLFDDLFFFNKFIYFIFIYFFWLCWVFIAVHGLFIAVASLVVEHRL